MNEGSKTCPIVGEFRDIKEGIEDGDYLKALANGGLLALYSAPICSSLANV